MSGLSAGACSIGRPPRTASVPTPRTAAAIARSFPTMSAVLSSSSATSAPRCASVAEPVDRSKPTIATPSEPTTTWREFERGVGDPGVVELRDLLPELVEHGIGDRRGLGLLEALTGDRADDEQRRAGTGHTGGHDRGHPHPGALGNERDVGLVLDLAQAGEVHLRPGVLVEDRAAELGDELRVGLVPAEDPDPARAVVAGARHHRAVAGLTGRERDLGVPAGELVNRGMHLDGRRPATGRSEDQVDDRGDPPAENDGRERAVGQRGAEVERGEREDDNRELTDAAHRPGEVGRGDRNDRDDHRQACEGERRRLVDAARVVDPVHDRRATDHDLADRARDEPRHRPGDRHVAREPPAPRHERRDDDQADGPRARRSGRAARRTASAHRAAR